MNPRETLQERNTRLRAVVKAQAEEIRGLIESDCAWARCCESLNAIIREKRWEARTRRKVKNSWRHRLHGLWSRIRNVQYTALD